MTLRAIGAIIFSIAAVAHAQRADCPRMDAPMPMKPPGAPPPILPPAQFPERWDDAVKLPPPQSRELSRDEVPKDALAKWDRMREEARRNDWMTEAEEGHVAAMARMSQTARAAALPPALRAFAVDVGRSPLATWTYLGFLERGRLHVARYFRAADGSVLELDEFAFKDAGGAIIELPGGSNASVSGRRAQIGGLRSPSGCVQSALSWQDDRVDYRLTITGPLELQRQRALLMQTAEAIATVPR